MELFLGAVPIILLKAKLHEYSMAFEQFRSSGHVHCTKVNHSLQSTHVFDLHTEMMLPGPTLNGTSASKEPHCT